MEMGRRCPDHPDFFLHKKTTGIGDDIWFDRGDKMELPSSTPKIRTILKCGKSGCVNMIPPCPRCKSPEQVMPCPGDAQKDFQAGQYLCCEKCSLVVATHEVCEKHKMRLEVRHGLTFSDFQTIHYSTADIQKWFTRTECPVTGCDVAGQMPGRT